MFHAKVKLHGLTTALIHSGSVIQSQMSQTGQDYSEEWRRTVYLDSKERKYLVFPSINMEALLRDSGKNKKLGKQALTKVIPVTCMLMDEEVPILFKDKPVTVDMVAENNWVHCCSAVVQRARIMRTRAAIPPGWSLEFTIRVRDGVITPKLLEELLTGAGESVGVGDWRPASPKPGRFGQFELIEFEIVG